MANHGCINGTLHGTKYSSPVPVIGLYIAAASLVCMLLMLYDIIAGFRARKLWLPCKLFTLNSVTLTLLSIATKLTIDLTTPMPRPKDQLSKLSGTALMVISMGFLLPSIGVNNETECFTNMTAMTIFVITVVVNICIQIFTGVIVLFIAEHIIILCCMLLMLMMLWFSAWDINNRKRISIDHNKKIFTKGNGSMFERLKTSYLFGYCSNAQLVLWMNPTSIVSGTICSICSFILIYDGYISLILKELKFCSGISDYDWSISIIVVIQILTVLVGSFAIIFRGLILFIHKDANFMGNWVVQEIDVVIDNNPVLGIVSIWDIYQRFLQALYIYTMVLLQFLSLCVPMTLRLLVRMMLFPYFPRVLMLIFWSDPTEDLEEDLEEWTESKSMEDMKILLVASKSRSLNHVSQLLFKTNPSQQFHTMEIKDQDQLNQEGVKVSSLSIVLLVRIAQVSLQGNLCETLVQAFREANRIFHFIDKTMNLKSLENDSKLVYAKAVWAGDEFSCLLPKIFDTSSDQPQSDLERAVVIITKLNNALPYDYVRRELGIIIDFINRKTYSSVEDLYKSMEQMFVDMSHMLLAQLPNAVFKVLNDSTAEDYEDNVRLVLKILCQVEAIESQIQWSFPEGCNISTLFTTNSPRADNV